MVDRGKPHCYGDVHTISLFQCQGCRSIVIYTTYYADAVEIDEAERLDPKWIFERGDVEGSEDFRVGTYTSLLHPIRQMATEPFEPSQLVSKPERPLSNYAPRKIREEYEEALRVKDHDPKSFVVGIRRALEAICIEQGFPGDDELGKNLKKLSLPPLVAEIADEIRVMGNAGAHIKARKYRNVGPREAQTIDDFFHLVVLFVYEAPSLLKEYQKRLRPNQRKIISANLVH